MYGFIEPDDYELCYDLHGPDDCRVYCVARGKDGGLPYWIGDAERDVCTREVALPRTGSDEPFDRVAAVLSLAGLVRG